MATRKRRAVKLRPLLRQYGARVTDHGREGKPRADSHSISREIRIKGRFPSQSIKHSVLRHELGHIQDHARRNRLENDMWRSPTTPQEGRRTVNRFFRVPHREKLWGKQGESEIQAWRHAIAQHPRGKINMKALRHGLYSHAANLQRDAFNPSRAVKTLQRYQRLIKRPKFRAQFKGK